MARYGKAFKDRAVARLLPPESAPVDVVSQELHISAATLERWRAAALAAPDKERIWTPAATGAADRAQGGVTARCTNEENAFIRQPELTLSRRYWGGLEGPPDQAIVQFAWQAMSLTTRHRSR